MATTAPIDRPLTADDLAELPDDGIRYELIWGELYMTPAPNTKHQRFSREVLIMIASYVSQKRVGEVFDAPYDVRFDELNVVQPDLVVVSAGRSEIITDSGVFGAPDICIEILSPGSRGKDFIKKNVLYAKFGVPEYWIVDPELERITVYRLEDGNYVPQESADGVARSIVIPGLEIDPRGLSSPPPSSDS